MPSSRSYWRRNGQQSEFGHALCLIGLNPTVLTLIATHISIPNPSPLLLPLSIFSLQAFQGRHGRAYLFSNVVNITLGPKEDRLLITGLHTVCDIMCSSCGTNLGWKYVTAFEESQKYKEGKYIIEKAKVLKEQDRATTNAQW